MDLGSMFCIRPTEIHLLSFKYKDFDLEIARMWKRKTETKPVVIGDLGSIHFLEGGGGVGRRNPYEHECKISQPSLYIFC